MSSTLAGGFFTTESPGKPPLLYFSEYEIRKTFTGLLVTSVPKFIFFSHEEITDIITHIYIFSHSTQAHFTENESG